MSSRRWTTEEEACIRMHAGKLPDREIATVLGRSVDAVKNRRQRITDVVPAAPRWSEPELAILRGRYPNTACAQMKELLPSRPWTAIMTKAQSIGLVQRSRRPNRMAWSEADRARLRQMYPHQVISDLLPHFPGRTALSVMQEAGRLGVKHTRELWKSRGTNHTAQHPPELRALIQLNYQLKKAIREHESHHQ